MPGAGAVRVGLDSACTVNDRDHSGGTRMKPWAGVVAIAALAATAFAGVSCGGTTPGPSSSCTKTYKVGLVTDVGKLSDKSFNFDSYNGVLDAAADSSL